MNSVSSGGGGVVVVVVLGDGSGVSMVVRKLPATVSRGTLREWEDVV